MSETLEPCPLCRMQAKEEPLYEGCSGWLVWCPKCGLRVWRGMSDGRGPDIARKVWNRRTPGPATKAMLAWCRKCQDPAVAKLPNPSDIMNAFLDEWPDQP